MKIAIVGSGISGLTVAHYLHRRHAVTIFEANSRVGGHTNTVELDWAGQRYAVDTGFIVYNERTYPNFCRLLAELGVRTQPTRMSFSLQCERSGLEYRGADWGGLFAQRRNLWNPKFYGLLWELLRFNREVEGLLVDRPDGYTVGEFFAENRFGRMFIEKFFLPMASAIWSCPLGRIEQFPIQFIVDFYRNHGLLSTRDHPQWRVITGGSQRYVEVLTRPFRDSIRLNTKLTGVRRGSEGVILRTEAGWEEERFDRVVFACHSDQALHILGAESTKIEREVLGAFPYETNRACLHTDRSLLPRNRRAWACWNYYLPADDRRSATMTYNMNLLQGLACGQTFCVSLNSDERIAKDQVIGEFVYEHPVFTAERRRQQSRQQELMGANRTAYCGAYWGNGFHEDGVLSALAVCQSIEQDSCTVASIEAGSGIAAGHRERMSFAIEST